MDKNRIEGTKHEIKGAIKETAGKYLGILPKQKSAGSRSK
jgi:uncharacterized protein YjbJ (UPF0337 family)